MNRIKHVIVWKLEQIFGFISQSYYSQVLTNKLKQVKTGKIEWIVSIMFRVERRFLILVQKTLYIYIFYKIIYIYYYM